MLKLAGYATEDRCNFCIGKRVNEMKIDKGKKIPDLDARSKHAPTLKKMEVGDSILVDENYYNSVYVWFRRNKKRCKRLKEKDGRVRIWRTD